MTLSALLASALTLVAQHGVMYHYPRWSPDGETIVVSAAKDADPEIWLLRLDGSAPLQLTDNSAFDDAAEWHLVVQDLGRREGRSLSRRAA